MNEIRHPGPDRLPANPIFWDRQELHREWLNQIRTIIRESESGLPAGRIRSQVEQTVVFREIAERWPQLSGSERLRAWKKLLVLTEECSRKVLPICVRCGECCRRSTPSLHLADLELLREGKIPWEKLYTIRRGEPVRAPDEDKLFHLLDERVKIREKPGTSQCIFLDTESNLCGIYTDRPIQCRAQVCWDPTIAAQFADEPYLTRGDIFQGVELLPDLMAEHDRRCAFGKLREAFRRLEETHGQSVDEVLELLSYESHFRDFFSKQLSIPPDMLPLVFGRSFAHLVVLFGFRVEEGSDGTRVLVPDHEETNHPLDDETEKKS
ncbi:MAG: YkgJ family cysteine cluster protein [Syntrophobacteraceae bacterium]|nr:YkgJ family cysteine cluster protein [Syntrophobacteraceae bacterium]